MTTSPYRRRRGAATQHLVAAHLQERGYPYALAVGSAMPGKDITGTPGLACEVKARRDFDPQAWLRQAVRNAAGEEVPIVVLRPDGAGETTIGSWPTILRFDDVLALLGYAGRDDHVGNQEGNHHDP